MQMHVNLEGIQLIPGTPKTDASAVMINYRLLSSAKRSNDDNDWPAKFLMLYHHDLRILPLRRLPSTVPCSIIMRSASVSVSHNAIVDVRRRLRRRRRHEVIFLITRKLLEIATPILTRT